MDRSDEFSKWMETIELAMTSDMIEPKSDHVHCDCGHWDCPVCYPEACGSDETTLPVVDQNVCPHCGHAHEETSNECDNQQGDFSPMTYTQEDEAQSPEEMVGAIEFMQDSGLSHSDDEFEVSELINSDQDHLSDAYNKVVGKLGENMISIKPSLYEQIQWDEQLNEFMQDAELEESSLSRLIGKMNGGQKLVSWLHRRHRLDNEADLQPASFTHRLFWTQFKADPDNFVIVSADNGVAAIKPYEKYIRTRAAEYAKKNKPYNPSKDNTIPYQIVAFTADGQQVDPALLKPESMDADGEPGYSDPTVTKARMGLHHGRDTQNPDNVFNLLAEQIGRLHTVWVTGAGDEVDDTTVHQRAWSTGAVPRGKMDARAELRKGPSMPHEQAIAKITSRLKPVLGTIIDQALSNIRKQAQQHADQGHADVAQQISASAAKLKQLQQAISSGDASSDSAVRSAIEQAIASLAQAKVGTPEYEEFTKDLALGNAAQLRPVLDSLRNKLVNL